MAGKRQPAEHGFAQTQLRHVEFSITRVSKIV